MPGRISGFEEKPNLERLGQIGQSVPKDSRVASWISPQRPFIASMGIYVFSKQVLLDALEQYADAVDFGKEIIPAVIQTHRVRAFLYRGYWEDVGTIGLVLRSQPEAHRPEAGIHLPRRDAPIYTHPRFLAGSTLQDCRINRAVVAEGCALESVRDRPRGRRHPHAGPPRREDHQLGAARRGLLQPRQWTTPACRSASARTSCSIA